MPAGSWGPGPEPVYTPSGWRNDTVGSAISTPALPAGTLMIFGAWTDPGMRSIGAGPPPHWVESTGVPQAHARFPGWSFGATVAQVFPGPDNTALIGFPIQNQGGLGNRSSPIPVNFMDFPLRILVSNICVM
jgi:hypothetical protein